VIVILSRRSFFGEAEERRTAKELKMRYSWLKTLRFNADWEA
jgi:hypothetical protein